MANRWGINGNRTDFIFLGSKITWMVTAAMKLKDICSLEEEQWKNLDSILKSRDIAMLTNVHVVKAMVFPVVTCGCESWTGWVQSLQPLRKVRYRRIDPFELWCWRRLLKVPWTTRRSNQSILKEINPEYSLEGLMLKLKLYQFGHLMQSANSLEKTMILENIEIKFTYILHIKSQSYI